VRTFLLQTWGTGLVIPLAVVLHFNNSFPCEWPNDLKCAASRYSINIVSVFVRVVNVCSLVHHMLIRRIFFVARLYSVFIDMVDPWLTFSLRIDFLS